MSSRDPSDVDSVDNVVLPIRWIIGEWTVTPDNGEIQRGSDAPIHVAPKHLAVLVLLAQNAGECVSRQQLIETVWTRQFVQDDVLTRIIADLRKLLGQQSAQDAYIVTVPKRGYRLVSPVRQIRVGRTAHVESSSLQTDQPVPNAATPGEPIASVAATPESAQHLPADPAKSSRYSWPAVSMGWVLILACAGLWLGKSSQQPTVSSEVDLSDSLRNALPAVAGPEFELMPRWIDDGRVFVYVEADSQLAPTRIMRFDLDRREKMVLIDDGHDNACPMMSPDGKQLVWTRLTESNCQLMLKLMPSGPITPLAACDRRTSQECPSFSANAEGILFTAPGDTPDAPGRLMLQNVLTGVQTEVLPRDFEPGWTPMSPRQSPDGRVMAFELAQHPPLSRIMLQAEDGTIRQVLAATHDHHGLAWSAAGNALLASSNALKYPGLVQLDPAAVLPPRLLGFRGARQPDVSRSGAVVYEQHQYQINLWAMRPGDSTPTRLTDSQYHDGLPRISPDGEWVLFASNRSGLEAVWLFERKTAAQHAVGLPADQRWLRPSWSLQSRQLAATRFQDGLYQSCVLNWMQAEPDCPDAMQSAVQAQELAPGEYVLERELEHSHQLSWLRADQSEQLIASGIRRWRAAGNRVVFSDEVGALHVWTRRDDGSAQVEPITTLNPEVDRLFSLHANRLCWLDEETASVRLLCRDLDTAADAQVLFTELPRGIRDFDVSPAGDWLVFERTVRVQVDLHAARADATPEPPPAH